LINKYFIGQLNASNASGGTIFLDTDLKVKMNASAGKQLEEMAPSSFAFVMATGILANVSSMLHYSLAGNILFQINVIAFVFLIILYVLKIVFHSGKMIEEISEHSKGAGYLTFVAGACILGIGFAKMKQNFAIAEALFFVALVAWLVIIYSFLSSTILKRDKSDAQKAIGGNLFLLVVSTQSLSILAGVLAPYLNQTMTTMVFICSCLFMLGIFLYLITATVDFYRMFVRVMEADENIPSQWITMGAAAITALSATMLTETTLVNPAFADLNSFIKSAAVLFWIIAVFWIPLLIIINIRLFFVRKATFNYSANWWSMAFPLGMFTAASLKMTEIIPLTYLQTTAQIFYFTAIASWFVILSGMVMHYIHEFTSTEKQVTMQRGL
jgi:tellurite resistance protein TehA-like permease